MLMPLTEAKELLLKKYPSKKVISAVDTSNYWVFRAVPKELNDKQKIDGLLDSAFMVNKRDGAINVFNPLLMDDKEFDMYVKASEHEITFNEE